MRVFAIDPGPELSAYFFMDSKIGPRTSSFGVVPTETIFRLMSEHRHTIDVVAIEMIASYGMSVGQEVFETCVNIGMFLREAYACDLKAHRVTRKQIVTHICNNPRGNDSTVRTALIDKYGQPGTKNNQGPTYGISKDCWSALAVATQYIETHERKE